VFVKTISAVRRLYIAHLKFCTYLCCTTCRNIFCVSVYMQSMVGSVCCVPIRSFIVCSIRSLCFVQRKPRSGVFCSIRSVYFVSVRSKFVLFNVRCGSSAVYIASLRGSCTSLFYMTSTDYRLVQTDDIDDMEAKGEQRHYRPSSREKKRGRFLLLFCFGLKQPKCTFYSHYIYRFYYSCT
jgi:hypothetical protein